MANVGGLCVALISRSTSNSTKPVSVLSELEKNPSASQLLATIFSEKLGISFRLYGMSPRVDSHMSFHPILEILTS